MQMAAVRHYCDEFKVLVAISEKCSSASVEAEEAAVAVVATGESNLVPPYKSSFGACSRAKSLFAPASLAEKEGRHSIRYPCVSLANHLRTKMAQSYSSDCVTRSKARLAPSRSLL
jgi:hypothetical protein